MGADAPQLHIGPTPARPRTHARMQLPRAPLTKQVYTRRAPTSVRLIHGSPALPRWQSVSALLVSFGASGTERT